MAGLDDLYAQIPTSEIANMLGADKGDVDNAIQSLVAVKQGTDWKIALFQNTPAQFHGRPEVAEALTEELRALL